MSASFVYFTDLNGHMVAVNPDLVRFVRPVDLDDITANLVFSDNHVLGVTGSVKEVVSQLDGDE